MLSATGGWSIRFRRNGVGCRGKTRPDKRMICGRCGETRLFMHDDQTLTAIIRTNRHVGNLWSHERRQWVNPFGIQGTDASLHKRLFVIDSHDLGGTWQHLGKVDTVGVDDGVGAGVTVGGGKMVRELGRVTVSRGQPGCCSRGRRTHRRPV